MKRTLASVLALALVLSLSVGLAPASAAEAQTFSPTVSPGLTEGETTVDTGIAGMTLTLGADEWSRSEADIDIVSASGVRYTGFLTGKANPKPAEGTGTYFTFAFDDSVETGALELMYRLNAGKAFYILDNGTAMEGFNGMKLDVSADTSTTILVEGGHTYTVYASGSKLRLYGCTFQNVDPAQVFAAEIAAFPFERVKGENPDIDHVDADLALMDSYESQFGSCDVSWTSSDPAVIDVDGTVNCQKTEAVVNVTGHFSVQENRALACDVTFAVTVLADPDDASAVAAAKAALTLGDLSSVKRNLDLPAAGKRGTAVRWTSSDESAVGADGKIYPANQADKTCVLTATITRGDAKDTKEFPVTVAGVVPVTLDSWSYSADGKIRFTPTDGSRLYAVSLTCNEPNPGADNVIVVTVSGPDGKEKTSVTRPMAEVFAGTPVGKSVIALLDIPMDAGDYFEVAVKAADGTDLITPVRNSDALAEGAKLYVVGDSTASVYGDDRYPRKGWAQMLGNYFDGVEVVDLALSGRSSKSFKNEANYTTLKNSLKPGDYLLIQFGHNDNKADAFADPAPDRFTDGSFRQSMLEYAELAWEKGAKPVIATSISRRKLSDASLEAYVKAAAELAADLSIPCIDLYSATNGWINEMGVEKAKDMFNCVKPQDPRFTDYAPFAGSEFYEKGSEDDTHLNIYGADLIAQWAVEAMTAQGLPLAAKVSGYRALYPLPAYAEAAESAGQDPNDTPSSGSDDHEMGLPAHVDGYADVSEGDWFYEGVWVTSQVGAFSGGGDGYFRPYDKMTRAMVATLMWKMAGMPADPELGNRSYYYDVPLGAWYAKAVTWCTESGVIQGDGAGYFKPDDPVTREQLAVIVYRSVAGQGLTGVAGVGDGSAVRYADAKSISAWAKDAVDWLTAKGLLTGKPGGLVDPQGLITRAETAVVFGRLLKMMAI